MNDSAAITGFETLLSKKLVLVTGKGGIGKSTIATALGQLSAEAGRRTLIVQNAAVDQISPLFGLPSTYDRCVQVQPRLDVLNVDSVTNFRDYMVEHLGQRRLYDTVFSNRVVKSLINAVPGWSDVMLLGRLLFECELRPNHEFVIFDAPASGHFMNLMTTPDAVLAMKLGGPLHKETQRVRSFLADPSISTTVYVGVPEELVVSECLDFLPQLRKLSPSTLGGLFMNRLPRALADLTASSPARDYALRHHAAAAEALKVLRTGLQDPQINLSDLPVWSVPDLGYITEPLQPGFGYDLLVEGSKQLKSAGGM